MARSKIDILTPIPHSREFTTTERFLPSTLLVIWNGQVLSAPDDFIEYDDHDGFRLSFKLPGNVNTTTDTLIAVYQILDQKGLTIQETIRKVNTEIRFQFIAKPGLTGDPRIIVYNNSGNVKLVDNVVMTEKDNQGVYEYSFTPTQLGTYTAIMKESAEYNIQVTEIIVADGDIQSIYEKILEIRQTQVLGTPRIIMGDLGDC
jgi:hypothetical protein